MVFILYLIYGFHFICECFRSRSRKVKSNEELCNEIREFLTALGLPEDHVPSTKELSLHGRFFDSFSLFFVSKFF